MTINTKLEQRSDRLRVAAWWHTALLTAILLGLAARGAMFQTAAATVPTAPKLIPVYASLIAAELVLLFAVLAGIRRTNTKLSDLIGGRWLSVKDVVRDLLLGLAFWAALTAIAGLWDRFSHVAGPLHSISALLPHTPIDMALWVVVSLIGGVTEEIVFRGYFQCQFEALTQSAWAALLLQATLFGVSHGYQGVSACIKITLIGTMFGLLAMWRRSLRPGMIAHVWTDVASGLFRI